MEIRCKLCNVELKSHPTQTKCCGCSNMVTIVGDKITAVDLSKVVMLNSIRPQKSSSHFSGDDLVWQQSRSNRKIRKLEFEVK